MIVDDHKSVQFIVRTIVSFFGFKEIREFTDGESAYEAHLQRSADLIILDLRMPGLDGLSLLRKIRWECKDKRQRVKAIVLSAVLDRDTVLNARDAGADALIAKPITARTICERVLQVIRDEREFVVTAEYIGPDRRVGSADHLYDGPERRVDGGGEEATTSEDGTEGVTDDDIDAMLAQ